jgi:CelD/BcsL family acetyltransferase involved in cellulose biosynthesis
MHLAGSLLNDMSSAEAILGAPLEVIVYTNLAAAEASWRHLERAGTGTAYQGFDFTRAWFETIGAAQGISPLIVRMHDAQRGVELIWPLAISQQMGCRIAYFAGGKHSNYNLPLGFSTALNRLDAGLLRAQLVGAVRASKVDLLVLEDQPCIWNDVAHPFVSLPHQAAPSSAWSTDLLSDPAVMTARLMSAESLKKLRKKERKLVELGALTYGRATTQADIDAALKAFFKHKSARFAAMGIANPFADAATMAFLEQATRLNESGESTLHIHTLKAGETIAALFGGLVHARRFSGMITSFDGDAAISKCSPGDLLLLHLITQLGAQGLTQFDLGIGDAAYKAGYCPREDKLFDSRFASSLKGEILKWILSAISYAKRRVKANAKLLAFARRF